jgi:hypothetical protein
MLHSIPALIPALKRRHSRLQVPLKPAQARRYLRRYLRNNLKKNDKKMPEPERARAHGPQPLSLSHTSLFIYI